MFRNPVLLRIVVRSFLSRKVIVGIAAICLTVGLGASVLVGDVEDCPPYNEAYGEEEGGGFDGPLIPPGAGGGGSGLVAVDPRSDPCCVSGYTHSCCVEYGAGDCAPDDPCDSIDDPCCGKEVCVKDEWDDLIPDIIPWFPDPLCGPSGSGGGGGGGGGCGIISPGQTVYIDPLVEVPIICSSSSSAGEAVHMDIATGNVWTQVPLFSSLSTGGVDLAMVLRYDSKRINNSSVPASGLGQGWTHSHAFARIPDQTFRQIGGG